MYDDPEDDESINIDNITWPTDTEKLGDYIISDITD